jgi:PBSX family phage terminase large subunit
MILDIVGLQNVQVFEPLPKQKLFLYHIEDNDEAKFIWYCGGFGSGKSYIGSQAVIRHAMQNPGGRSLIARQTLVDLKATTMKTFFEVLDPRLIKKWNKTENLLTFINGHEIYFWGLDDIEKLKSLEIGFFWIDEVNEVAENTFNVLKGRLRNKRHKKRLGILTSNSEGKNWTYKQFVLGKGIRTAKDLEKYWIIKAPSNENTYLPEDYLEVLNSYTGDLFERYVKASWNVFEGQIFPDFHREIHVIKPFAIPETWRKIGGIDHGERSPSTFVWAAISPSGNIFIYREYSLAGEGVDMHVKNIKELNRGEKLDYIVIDPSVKSVRGTSGRKIDTEYKEEWIKQFDQVMPLRYANNDVNAGIARLHKYFRIDPERIHPSTKKKGSPRLYYFDTCPQAADDTEGYKWKKISPTNENDPEEKPRKKDDHVLDPIRYIVMSRPDIKQASATKMQTTEREDRKLDPHGQALDAKTLLEHHKKQFKGDFIDLDE